jgi:hypothetical protein
MWHVVEKCPDAQRDARRESSQLQIVAPQVFESVMRGETRGFSSMSTAPRRLSQTGLPTFSTAAPLEPAINRVTLFARIVGRPLLRQFGSRGLIMAKATTKRKPAKKAAAKKSTRKVATKKAATKKRATKKASVKKTARKAVRKVATKKRATKKTAIKKRATKKTATRKTATKKRATKKTSTRKATAKKRAPRKVRVAPAASPSEGA